MNCFSIIIDIIAVVYILYPIVYMIDLECVIPI